VADWTLTYPGTSFTFGSRESGFGFVGAPDIGDAGVINGDVQRDGVDGRLFGRDTLDGRTVTFRLDVVRATEAEARAALEGVRRAWRGDALRGTPGAVAQLQSGSGRSAFGRPRRFWSDDTYIALGTTTIDCDFQTADDLWYGPEQSLSVALTPDELEAMEAPFIAPFVFLGEQERAVIAYVGGTAATWPVFTVTGPISGPEVVGSGWVLSFPDLIIAAGEVLTVDTRPWARTILLGDASVAGALAPAASRLVDAQFTPGAHVLKLRGTTQTGNPTLTATWRDAFTTP